MNLKTKIESLLFVSDRPLSAEDILKVFGEENAPSAVADLQARPAKEDIEKNLEEIFNEYKEKKCGIIIIKNSGKYQMSSAPESADVVRKFLSDETTGELTRPQLETLTIIAYRGPIGKTELEQIRGVNCSLVLRNLLMRGLVEESEKDAEPAYSVTLDFLKFLGINSAEELPDYQKLHNNEVINQVIENENLS
jgi:segregation and condensation protein B